MSPLAVTETQQQLRFIPGEYQREAVEERSQQIEKMPDLSLGTQQHNQMLLCLKLHLRMGGKSTHNADQ